MPIFRSRRRFGQVLSVALLASAMLVPTVEAAEATAAPAGELAIAGAQPLHHNAYKVPLMRNLVKRAIRGTGATAATT